MSILDTLGSAVSSVLDAIPGSSWVKDAINSGQTFLGNIAKNPAGATILAVLGTGFVTQLGASLAAVSIPSVSGAQTVGPQIASVVFAIPGMAIRKQDFVSAYTQEFVNRVTGLVAFFAGPEGQDTLNDLSKSLDDAFFTPLKKLLSDSTFVNAVSQSVATASPSARATLHQAGLDPVAQAAKRNIRPDVVATAINGVTGQVIYKVGTPGLPFSEFNADGSPNADYNGSEQAALVTSLTKQIAQAATVGDFARVTQLTSQLQSVKAGNINGAGAGATAPAPSGPGNTATPGLRLRPAPPQTWTQFGFTLALVTSPLWVPRVHRYLVRKHP